MLRTDLDNTLDLIGTLSSWRATMLYAGLLCALVAAFVLDFAGRPRLRSAALARAYSRVLTTSLALLAPVLLIGLMFVLFVHGFRL
jgi:hypothetical protein